MFKFVAPVFLSTVSTLSANIAVCSSPVSAQLIYSTFGGTPCAVRIDSRSDGVEIASIEHGGGDSNYELASVTRKLNQTDKNGWRHYGNLDAVYYDGETENQYAISIQLNEKSEIIDFRVSDGLTRDFEACIDSFSAE